MAGRRNIKKGLSKKRMLFFLFPLLIAGCSLNRTLPEGKRIYTGSKLDIKKAEKGIAIGELKSTYETILKTPKPNKKLMGIRWGLRFHNLFHSKKNRKLWRWLQKKLGEPPVIYDEQVTEKTEQLFKNRAFNQGFFHAKVESEVKKKKEKGRREI